MSIDDLLRHPAVTRFDHAVDEALEPLRGVPAANRLMYGLSEAANHSMLWHAIAVVGALGTARAEGAAAARRRLSRHAVAIGTESALVNGPIKSLFRRERPVHDGERPHALRTPRTSSFPSGHATSGFFAAVLFSEEFGRRAVWYPLAALVATSRVHVRIHHASDVVAGAAVGYGLGRVARRVMRRFP